MEEWKERLLDDILEMEESGCSDELLSLDQVTPIVSNDEFREYDYLFNSFENTFIATDFNCASAKVMGNTVTEGYSGSVDAYTFTETLLLAAGPDTTNKIKDLCSSVEFESFVELQLDQIKKQQSIVTTLLELINESWGFIRSYHCTEDLIKSNLSGRLLDEDDEQHSDISASSTREEVEIETTSEVVRGESYEIHVSNPNEKAGMKMQVPKPKLRRGRSAGITSEITKCWNEATNTQNREAAHKRKRGGPPQNRDEEVPLKRARGRPRRKDFKLQKYSLRKTIARESKSAHNQNVCRWCEKPVLGIPGTHFITADLRCKTWKTCKMHTKCLNLHDNMHSCKIVLKRVDVTSKIN